MIASPQNTRRGARVRALPGVLALLLPAAIVMLTGCLWGERRGDSGAADRQRAEVIAAELVGDPEDGMKGLEPELPPAALVIRTPPVYRMDRIPLRPPVVGKLDVPIKRKWNYIVVHHSGSAAGNMEIFDRCHKDRGWQGVGYHFVIGNGSHSKDGAVEVTFRWTQQLHGAHAGVREYNQHGIGICLVGDFERTYPTEPQMASLVSLVNYLQERTHIPTHNIMLHRQIKSTDCPGRNFQYYQMVSLLPH